MQSWNWWVTSWRLLQAPLWVPSQTRCFVGQQRLSGGSGPFGPPRNSTTEYSTQYYEANGSVYCGRIWRKRLIFNMEAIRRFSCLKYFKILNFATFTFRIQDLYQCTKFYWNQLWLYWYLMIIGMNRIWNKLDNTLPKTYFRYADRSPFPVFFTLATPPFQQILRDRVRTDPGKSKHMC